MMSELTDEESDSNLSSSSSSDAQNVESDKDIKNINDNIVPMKSSKEILSELFGVFNAKPPSSPSDLSYDSSCSDNFDDSVKNEISYKKAKKHKTKKSKKHKHKSSDNVDKKRHKHKKKTKKARKGKVTYSFDSDKESSEGSNKLLHKKICNSSSVNRNNLNIINNNIDESSSKRSDVDNTEEKKDTYKPESEESVSNSNEDDNRNANINSHTDISIIQSSNNIEETSITEINNDSAKKKISNSIHSSFDFETTKENNTIAEKLKIAPSKIVIKDLKHSAVYEATIKEVEEKERLKAEKYEDGELTSSSYSEEHSHFSDLCSTEDLEGNPEDEHARSKHRHKRLKKSGSKSDHHSKRSNRSRSRHRSEKHHYSRSHSRKKNHTSRSSYRSSSHQKDRHESRSRHREHSSHRSHSVNKHKRKHDKSRSRSRRSHSVSKHKRKHDKSRSRSCRSHSANKHKRKRHKSRSRSRRSHSVDKHKRKHDKSRSRSRTNKRKSSTTRSHDDSYRSSRYSRSHSRSKSRSKGKSESKDQSNKTRDKSSEKFDKQKLLEIARKNAINMLEKGELPQPLAATVTKGKLALFKSGGKTVSELTDFCKLLSKKEADGRESISSDTDSSTDEHKKAFHHPFQLKDRPSSIVMNIRNSVPLPIKTAQEKTAELSKHLRLQFPVSSGQEHKTTQDEWINVDKAENVGNNEINCGFSQASSLSTIPQNPPLPVMAYSVPPPPPPPPLPPLAQVPSVGSSIQSNVDVGFVVAQRLDALRRLSENPNDMHASSKIQDIDQKMKVWAESKQPLGKFTGSTGVKILKPSELAAGYQPWIHKNQFKSATPVTSGFGMNLLQKMGWKPGEGLGKHKQGPINPFEIDIKVDKKGLISQADFPKPVTTFNQSQSSVGAIQSKHPVSLLNEYCSRKKLGPPVYNCTEISGAANKKLFHFTVVVQGKEHKAKIPSNNKKQAKLETATICLQGLGLLPTTSTSVN